MTSSPTPTLPPRGLFIYDLKTGKTREHVNKKLNHLYTLNWTPDGKWFVATIHGALGFSHAIVAIEANGDKVFNLNLDGCRPNVSRDGKHICWGHGDFCAGVADLDLSGPTPKTLNHRDVVQSKDPIETYHITWSPDMKYITFTSGPKFKGKNLRGLLPEFPGVEAPGWNVCVADVMHKGPLGRRNQRRQIVQATKLAVRQARGTEMRGVESGEWRVESRMHNLLAPHSPLPTPHSPLFCRAGFILVVLLTLSGCQKSLPAPSTITTSSGIEMVLIPAGSFEMGSRHGPEDERPVHKVWIDSFLMDRYEVTQAEFEKVGRAAGLSNAPHFKGPRPAGGTGYLAPGGPVLQRTLAPGGPPALLR